MAIITKIDQEVLGTTISHPALDYYISNFRWMPQPKERNAIQIFRLMLKDDPDLVKAFWPIWGYRTFLMEAAFDGDEELVRILLEAGSEVNASDLYGNTALHWAADQSVQGMGQEHVEVVRHLVKAGADVNAQNFKPDRTSSLEQEIDQYLYMVNSEKSSSVSNLVSHNTPLHIIFEKWLIVGEVVDIILAKNPDNSIINAEGKTWINLCAAGCKSEQGELRETYKLDRQDWEKPIYECYLKCPEGILNHNCPKIW